MKRKLIQIFYDHWLVLFSLFGVGIFSYLKNLFPKIAVYLVPLWICVAFFLLTPVATWAVLWLRKSGQVPPAIQLRPGNRIQTYEDQTLINVCWKVWIGHDGSFVDRRVWADGPYCPHCKYELDHFPKYWFCITCDKKFYIPKKFKEYPNQKVIKIFSAMAEKAGGLKPKEADV